ncbi:MAG: DUF2207 domain-containing protein, partial [Clostridiales bacterium]|nr:DUF2207 domain-containing protein [Clostridiales bacterium]
MAIREKLTVGFIKGGVNTGIIRDIQRISRTTRIVDGKRQQGEKYIANISDVSVTINGGEAKVTEELYNQGQFHSVKMQLPDESYFPATDQQDKNSYNVFELSYIYDMSDDKVAGYDDFTFDVLGYAMAYTSGFKATITFPDEIERNDISIRTNKMQEWSPTVELGERFLVRGNTVQIGAAPQHENVGYTLQVIFADGYFDTAHSFRYEYIAFILLAMLGMAAGIVLYIKFRPVKPIAPITFYPPKGMRAMRFSAVYYGKARTKDVAAVIVQWAQEGYVRIEKDGRKDLFVYKLKDLPAYATNEEKRYFDAMFKPLFGDEPHVFSTREMRLGKDLTRGRSLSSRASSLVAAESVPDPLFQGGLRAHVLFTMTSLIPILAVLVYNCILNASALPLFFFVFMAAGTAVGSLQAREWVSPLMCIFPISFMGLPLFAFFAAFYFPNYDYIGLIYIALAWWAAVNVLLYFYKKRSPEAQAQYALMLGFKRFLLTAEVPQLEKLLDENPEYYYEIIPYCLVMGISAKVERRFSPLGIAAPAWADGISLGHMSSLSHSLSSSSG